MDFPWRYDQDVDCTQAGYPSNGGNTKCTNYIAVECPAECTYRITIQFENFNSSNFNFSQTKNVPIPVTGDNYYNGKVNKDQVKYFYYPVTSNTGDLVVFLNKTGPIGQNGDSKLVLAVQSDNGGIIKTSTSFNFEGWFYPNATSYRIASSTGNVSYPEIIEVCPRTMNLMCAATNS